LDELGLDRQAVLGAQIEGGVASEDFAVGEAEGQDQVQRHRTGVSDPHELMRGKLSTLSVARLLLYADLLGAEGDAAA
jgi:hypothetical protein